MANKHATLTSLFTDIADSIRTKTGRTDNIIADEFPDAIDDIPEQEDLDAELTTQDSLISQIISALDGKSGGVSAPEMCTVSVVNNSDDAITLYPKYEGYSGSINVDRFESASITVPKQSAVWFTGWVPLGGRANPTTAGSVTVGSCGYEGMAAIYSDGTITINNN